MHGSVVASNCLNGDCTWTITSQDVTSGVHTSLTVTDSNNYQLALGGAVEVYGLTSCDQFPVNGVSFSSISLLNHRSMTLTPTWTPTIQSGASPSCGFNVTSTATSVNLFHNAASITASGGLTANAGNCLVDCQPPYIVAVTATTGTGIVVKDNYGHTGTIVLKGASGSGGLTASTGTCLVDCQPAFIVAVTGTSGAGILVKDNYGHSGSIALTGAIASGGLTASAGNCVVDCIAPDINSVTASGGNGIIMTDNYGNRNYAKLSP